MSNLYIARPTLSDAATVTLNTETEEADYPLTNLLATQPRDIFRTQGTTAFDIRVDFGTATSIDTVALLYTNGDATVDWQIQGNATDSWGGPTYDSGTITHNVSTNNTYDRIHAIHTFAAQSLRWWRIDISNMGGLSYYQAGRLIVAGSYNPTKYPSEIQYGIEDPSASIDTQGARFIRSEKLRRTVLMSLEARAESEAFDNLMDLDQQIGQGKEVFVIVDSSAYLMERSIYCHPSQIGVFNIRNTSGNVLYYSKSYTFTELEHP